MWIQWSCLSTGSSSSSSSTPIILVYFVHVQYIQLWRVLVAQIRDSDYAIESDMKRGQLVLSQLVQE